MVFTKLLTIYSAAGVIVLVAWVLNTARLYWMAGVLILLPHASRLLALLEQRGLEVSRDLPLAAHQGETVRVRYRVRNRWALPKLHLSLSDELPPALASDGQEPIPVHLPPYGTDRAEYPLRLRRRGVHVLPGIRVQSTDLLGLGSHEGLVPCSSRIMVYPRIIDLPDSALPPDLGGGNAPVTAAQRKGEGSSFFGIREYRPGDPLRHVHWRTAARVGQLTVVEWEAETSTDALLALETLRGSERELDGGTTLDLAAGFAASLAAATLAAGDSVRLLAPGTGGWRSEEARGATALPELMETLARVEAASDVSLAAELRRISSHLGAGTLVCWFASRTEDLAATARYLRAANLNQVVYALIDTPRGAPGPWDVVEAELAALQVPVIRIHRDDDLVRRLLN